MLAACGWAPAAPGPTPLLHTSHLPRFVTYKWPSWLHKQTEKQRIIWAYKILFLDVLFPLGLKKVRALLCRAQSAAARLRPWACRCSHWSWRTRQPAALPSKRRTLQEPAGPASSNTLTHSGRRASSCPTSLHSSWSAQVIFCDSDQVVRADLRELWHMDLQVGCFHPAGSAGRCGHFALKEASLFLTFEDRQMPLVGRVALKFVLPRSIQPSGGVQMTAEASVLFPATTGASLLFPAVRPFSPTRPAPLLRAPDRAPPTATRPSATTTATWRASASGSRCAVSTLLPLVLCCAAGLALPPSSAPGPHMTPHLPAAHPNPPTPPDVHRRASGRTICRASPTTSQRSMWWTWSASGELDWPIYAHPVCADALLPNTCALLCGAPGALQASGQPMLHATCLACARRQRHAQARNRARGASSWLQTQTKKGAASAWLLLTLCRQIAAGDRLRVMYDGLSKDPNSLSNLDQDLPNYAQVSV